MFSGFTKYCLIAFLLVTALPGVVSSEQIKSDIKLLHTSISDLSQEGRHFEAVVEYENKKGEDVSLRDMLGAARSAWALNLVDRAREIWDTVLARKDFDGVERARTFLGRAALELQEGNYEDARRFAERGVELVEPSDLRSQFWMLIGESLRQQGVLSRSEEYYRRATEEGSETSKAEALYLLGDAQRTLGMHQAARFTFTSIPLSSAYTDHALLGLIEIDFAERDYQGVLTWFKEGSQQYPQEFGRPRIQYIRISALVETEQFDKAEKALKEFKVQHSDKNEWYVLAEATFESKRLQSELSAKSKKDS